MPTGRTQLVHDERLTITLGALATKAAILVNTPIDALREQGCRLKKVKAWMEYNGHTNTEGPIIVGLAAGLSNAEIAEALSADPQHWKDISASEEANRRVYPVWVISSNGQLSGSSTAVQFEPGRLRNIGVPSWLIIEGEALSWFAFNSFTSDLSTGTIVDIVTTYVTTWESD